MAEQETKIKLSDIEVTEHIAIKNPEIVKKIKELKEQGAEGVEVGVTVGWS